MNILQIILHHQPNCFTEFFASIGKNLAKANEFPFEKDFVAQFSAIIAGFISITIPIALDVVSRQTENYKDKEISESFLNERTYKFQVNWILPVAFLSIMIYAFKVESGYWIWLVILLDALAMANFILFIKVVQQYATNFDNYYSTKLKREIDEIIQETREN
ncbi:hypothetical protein [Pedobacter sp. JCM 36344]|uniref:hypothetical protein n=1 Tax=Pedobacter sp. JCM 36344 TaxID=3374280 RepID=UPI00397924EF